MVWIPWFDTAEGVGVLRKTTNSPYIVITIPLYMNTQISNLYPGFQIIIKPFLLVCDIFDTFLYVIYMPYRGLDRKVWRVLEV